MSRAGDMNLRTNFGGNTSLHLAEYRADHPRTRRLQESSAILVEGIRQWVTYSSPLLESNDFATLGAAYEATHQLKNQGLPKRGPPVRTGCLQFRTPIVGASVREPTARPPDPRQG